MARVTDFDRKIRTGAIAGLSALALNFIFLWAAPGSFIPIGNIFLFMAALSLGPLGGIVAVATGIIPFSVLFAEPIEGVRLIVLCLALGYSARSRIRFPGFIIALGLWLTVFGPGLIWMRNSGMLSTVWSDDRVALQGLSEIAIVMVAGALLLNSTIWVAITRTPRYVPLSDFMAYIFSLVALTSMFGALIVTHAISGVSLPTVILSHNINIEWLVVLAISVLVAPALCGERVAAILTKNFQELFNHNIMLSNGSQNKSFSGLSSSHWRRQGNNYFDSARWQESVEQDQSSEDAAEKTSQGIVALSEDGTIAFCNKAFRSLCGVTEQKPAGKHLTAIGIDAEFAAQLLRLHAQTKSKGPQSGESKLSRPGSKSKWLEITSQASSTLDGNSEKAAAVIITLKDISERRTLEEHLLKAQKLGSLGTLVKGLAHEINNALTAITAQAEVAKRSGNQDSSGSAMSQIIECSRSAGNLIGELLDFAEDGQRMMRVENLSTIIENKLSLLKTLVGEKYEVNYERPVAPVSVSCDQNLLMQALTNLVQNGRESYAEGGAITISLDTENIDEVVSSLHMGARPGNFARLRVRDSGVGMNRDVLERAFEPLFTTKSTLGNSGLGLSIVHSIVRAHGGFLTAESHPGKGTTISIYLPLCENSATRVDTTLPVSTQTNSGIYGHNERILVVEDEPSVRDLVSSMLSALGYRVTSCAGGSEAIGIAQKDKFDLLLVDMIMPKMSATELITKLKSDGVNLPSLIMTGYGPGAEGGGQAVIRKPFDIETLAQAIKSQLHQQATAAQS